MKAILSTRMRVLLVALVVVLATMPGLAMAEPRAGGAVVVAEGQTVDGLETFAGSVVVRGTVDGDLSAFAGEVTIAPTGRVTGDVSSAAGSVRIAGSVGGDVSVAAGDVFVAEGATVEGRLQAGAGTLRIDGDVAGDVTAGAETITLGPSASVGGDLTYDGRLRGNRDAVDGRIERDPTLSGPVVGPFPTVSDWAFGVYGFLVNLVLGALLLVVFPGLSRRVADRAVEVPARAAGVGLVAIVAVPVVLVLVALTIVGIPLTVVGALLFAIAAWAGAVYGRFAVGTWLTSYLDTDDRWVALVLGFLVVAVLVRVPWLGWFAEVAVFLLGFGALVLVADERRRSRRASSEPTPGPGGDVDAQSA